MSDRRDVPKGLIWATRGRHWGFRFLLDGGLSDPLPEYERALAGLEGESEVWRRSAGTGALRFLDPEGRRDGAGRIIQHDLVVPESWAEGISSVEEALRQVWPLLAATYAEVWASEVPPSRTHLASALRSDPPSSGHGVGSSPS